MSLLKAVLTTLAVSILGTGAAAQEGTISGSVFIREGGPAAGANVVLADTKYGAQVGADGTFRIDGIPAGEYRVEARLIGYETAVHQKVRVAPDREATVKFDLQQQAIELSQVEVTNSRHQDASDVRASVTTLTPRESKVLPGCVEDVMRSLQAIPGVSGVAPYSAQIAVRGGGPDQNLILLDGFEILNPYRLYGVISMFNPATASDINLQTGGFSAQYGGRLSSVLDVHNRDGRSDTPLAVQANASLSNANIVTEGRLPIEGGTYLFSFRRTYYDLILGPILKSANMVDNETALPNFRDMQGRFSFSLGKGHTLAFNALASRDGAMLISGKGLGRPDSVNVFDQSYNTLIGGLWRWAPANSFVAETRVSWYKNDGSGQFGGSFLESVEDPSTSAGGLLHFAAAYHFLYGKTSLAQRWLVTAGAHMLEAGFGVDHLTSVYDRRFDLDPIRKNFFPFPRGRSTPTDASIDVRYNRFNSYLQDKFSLGQRLFIQPGIRVDWYPVLRSVWYLSPRLNISYKLDDLSSIRAAYGVFYQPPGMENLDFRALLLFTREALGNLVAERADHYVLGYDRMVSPAWQFKAETYYKRFTNCIVPEWLPAMRLVAPFTGTDPRDPASWGSRTAVPGHAVTQTPVNGAVGRSYGIEVSMQKIRALADDRFSGWISYALSYATRERDGITSPFVFDQRHALNIFGNYRFAERWDIGAKFTLRSGRPVSEPEIVPKFTTAIVDGRAKIVPMVDANGRTVLDTRDPDNDIYTGRLNLYHTLDLRITTYPEWWGLEWSLYLDIQNVYNRKNEEAANFYIKDDGTLGRKSTFGLPIFPSIGLGVTL